MITCETTRTLIDHETDLKIEVTPDGRVNLYPHQEGDPRFFNSIQELKDWIGALVTMAAMLDRLETSSSESLLLLSTPANDAPPWPFGSAAEKDGE